MNTLTLTTPSGSTEVRIGSRLSRDLDSLRPKPVLLVDENVLHQHHDLFSPFPVVTIPSGEACKTLQTMENIYRELLRLEVDRSCLLVGVGGGLATDMAGFAAATYLRELSFGFVSSTLLGQVDASIGGKNGVNLDGYKNMIGTVRQPRFVWCDLDLLRTLARKEYISGIAEVVKYGAIRDWNFLDYLEDHMEGLLDQSPEVLEEVVTRSIRIKAAIVEMDEKESGMRRLLNFGHTFGHAIERDHRILHGQAVSLGMVLAAKISVRLGMLEEASLRTLERVLGSAGLPVEESLDPDRIYDNLRKDKKKEGENVHFILLEGLGNAVVRTLKLEECKKLLHDLC